MEKIISTKTRKVEVKEIAPTVSVIYSGPFDPKLLSPSVMPCRNPSPIVQAIVDDNLHRWSEIQEDGQPRFTNELTSGVQNIKFESDGSIRLDVVLYPFYVKLAERGKDVSNPEQLDWLKTQFKNSGQNNFDVGITYSFACALLVKYANGTGFILQERSVIGAQNSGKITASVTGSFNTQDLKDGKLDLVAGAKRELLEERGITDADITSFKSSLIVYEGKLREFMYIAVVETALTEKQILEKGKNSIDSKETSRQILITLDDADPNLISELRSRATPAARIAMYAGLKDSESGAAFLQKISAEELKDATRPV